MSNVNFKLKINEIHKVLNYKILEPRSYPNKILPRDMEQLRKNYNHLINNYGEFTNTFPSGDPNKVGDKIIAFDDRLLINAGELLVPMIIDKEIHDSNLRDILNSINIIKVQYDWFTQQEDHDVFTKARSDIIALANTNVGNETVAWLAQKLDFYTTNHYYKERPFTIDGVYSLLATPFEYTKHHNHRKCLLKDVVIAIIQDNHVKHYHVDPYTGKFIIDDKIGLILNSI